MKKKIFFLFFVWAQYKIMRLTRTRKRTNTSSNVKKWHFKAIKCPC